MIIANENELLNPMVTIPLWQHEDGIRAIQQLMQVESFIENSDKRSPEDMISCLKVLLGLNEKKRKDA